MIPLFFILLSLANAVSGSLNPTWVRSLIFFKTEIGRSIANNEFDNRQMLQFSGWGLATILTENNYIPQLSKFRNPFYFHWSNEQACPQRQLAPSALIQPKLSAGEAYERLCSESVAPWTEPPILEGNR